MELDKIIQIKDPEMVNDYLIELGKNPDEMVLQKIRDIIFLSQKKENFKRIEINLIWLLGELSLHFIIEDDLIEFIINEYYNSDRWIRNEIIIALENIFKEREISNKVIDLLLKALSETYDPIVSNACSFLLNIKIIPKSILQKLIVILKSDNIKLRDQSISVLKTQFNKVKDIFEMLNQQETYNLLDNTSVRAIIQAFLDDLFRLEEFRKLLVNSSWEPNIKQQILSEIDTYQKILIKFG